MFHTQNRTPRTFALGVGMAIAVMATLVAMALPSPAHARARAAGNLIDIQYDLPSGIHYVEDPAYPGEPIVLYCMNSQRAWPHGMDGVNPPAYLEGYLTPDMFDSPQQYEECMGRLQRILYAGYPNNGEHLYRLVQEGEVPVLTPAEYNRMLKAPKELVEAFPYLAHHDFSLSDYYEHDTEHLDVLKRFIADVAKLAASNATTVNGLTGRDIAVMPFHRAAYCIVRALNTENLTPEQAFSETFLDTHFVTHETAYNATQNAIWATLHHFGVEANNFDKVNLSGLALTLYEAGKRGDVLEEEPDPSKVSLAGDLSFTYNPKDGMWHSGMVHVEEPEHYRGVYQLTLPKGVTALCDNLTYVYAGEEYELLSDHKPTAGEKLGIEAQISWMVGLKQYRPSKPATVDGKLYQSMIGELVRTTSVGHTYALQGEAEGDLVVSKQVSGPAPAEATYSFEVRLDAPINGLYGDMEFHGGVAKFDLKAGETARGLHIPAGTSYEVKELSRGSFETTSKGESGVIKDGGVANATFTNVFAEEPEPEGPESETPGPEVPETEEPEDGRPGPGAPNPEGPKPEQPEGEQSESGAATPQGPAPSQSGALPQTADPLGIAALLASGGATMAGAAATWQRKRRNK